MVDGERYGTCPQHGTVLIDYGDDGHIAHDGPDTTMGHDPGCWGNCDQYGCPVPVQADPRYPCGPVTPISDHEVTFAVDPSRDDSGLSARCSCGQTWHDTSPLAPKVVADQVVEHLREQQPKPERT